jgi:hypothetical protein
VFDANLLSTGVKMSSDLWGWGWGINGAKGVLSPHTGDERQPEENSQYEILQFQ